MAPIKVCRLSTGQLTRYVASSTLIKFAAGVSKTLEILNIGHFSFGKKIKDVVDFSSVWCLPPRKMYKAYT
jgi:hypothetical protein